MRSVMPNVDSCSKITAFGEHGVPGLWHFMFPDDVFYFRPDSEARSSCFSCPKVKEAGFHPEVRCCTVIPRVPNFLIGLGLKAGNLPLQRALEKGMFLPEGLIISPADLNKSLQFIASPNAGMPNVVCPFLELDTKRCGIYAFRTTTCSTFFCKTDRGEFSHRFWSDFADLGSQVESALSQWALMEVGFDLDKYFAVLNTLDFELSEHWSSDVRRELFGDWYDRERELFIATSDAVLENRTKLFEIAGSFAVRQAQGFDANLRALFEGVSTAELIDEALPVGEPESIASLWYQLKLAARNLQSAPKTW